MSDILGPDGEPINKPMLGNKPMPTNDESLSAVEIIGRCSKCNAIGTLEYPKNMIPAGMIDKIMSYRPIPNIRCLKCNAKAEFMPIEVKKYADVPFLKTVQKQAVEGIPKPSEDYGDLK